MSQCGKTLELWCQLALYFVIDHDRAYVFALGGRPKGNASLVGQASQCEGVFGGSSPVQNAPSISRREMSKVCAVIGERNTVASRVTIVCSLRI